MLLAVGVSGCQTPGTHEHAQRETAHRVVADVAMPPQLEGRQLSPMTGEALVRAQRSLEEVLADLPEPAYLAQARQSHVARESDVESGEPGEPTLAVQRAYARARQAWREERYHDAINEAEAALRREPGQPNLLRLLAQAYGSAGNRLRAAMHLREALAADPDHLDSLFVLGRMALEQDEPGDAVVLFARALAVATERDEAGAQSLAMLHYHLAAALLDMGHAAAAIEQHRTYLDLTSEGTRGGSPADESALHDRQQASTWVAVGDAHHRLGDSASALEAYEQAAEHGLADEPGLIHRRVYTHLRLGDAEPAVQLTIQRIRDAGGDEASLELVGYLARQGVSRDALADELKRLYLEEDESPAMAMAVAELLPREQALALLQQHLARHPADGRVFDRVLNDWLLPDGAKAASAQAIHDAVAMTATAMTHASSYGEAESRLGQLFAASREPGALLDAWPTMPAEQRDEPMVRVIKGVALAQVGRLQDAEAVFERALAGDDAPDLARLQLAKLMIGRQRFDRAAALLEPLATSTDTVPVLLRVRVLAETEQADEALALLEQVMREQGRPSAQLVLQKARLQVMAGDARAAERTLLDALNTRPEEEQFYAALFDLYAPGTPTADQIGDWQRQWTRLVRRLLGTIPESRLGRLVRAQLLDAQGQRGEAEALLEQLLANDPRDHEALQQLLEVYVRGDRRDEARALMEAKLEAQPKDAELLRVAQRFYQQLGDRQRMLEVVEQLLSLEPADAARARNLASLYMQTDRPAQAVAAIEAVLAEGEVDDPLPLVRVLWRAILQAESDEAADRRLRELTQQMPAHRDALTYERAMLAEQRGDRQASEKLLLDVLDRNPEHDRANNALGYSWLTQDRELERAKQMIQRAVDAEPDNAAYLDSLGWAYYKLGRFEEAVVWLRRSRAAAFGAYPVIMDHLGDALYRAGKPEEAVRAWREAHSLLETGDFSVTDDPELEGLPRRVSDKIDAVANDGREPAVATVPGDADAGGAE